MYLNPIPPLFQYPSTSTSVAHPYPLPIHALLLLCHCSSFFKNLPFHTSTSCLPPACLPFYSLPFQFLHFSTTPPLHFPFSCPCLPLLHFHCHVLPFHSIPTCPSSFPLFFSSTPCPLSPPFHFFHSFCPFLPFFFNFPTPLLFPPTHSTSSNPSLYFS